MSLRKLGIYGESLPTKKSKTVAASDFLIGGIIGKFERKYKKAFETHNPEEFREIFGNVIDSASYGWDAVKGFFDNVVGVDAKLWGVSHVGYTGSAFDAVAALATLVDQAISPVSTLKLESAYKGELDYGVSGNRTGYQIVNGARFTTACDGGPLTGNTFVVLDSVAGIKTGDIVKFLHLPATSIYKKVTSVDEANRKVNFATAFGSSAFVDNDPVTVLGFQLKTFRKSTTGIVTEVETELGQIWCTMEPEVTDFYVQNVHANNKWIKPTDLSSASTLQETFPADVSTTAYLLTGADGTTPSSVAHWSQDLPLFNDLPVRFLANPETTNTDIQKSIETYCRSRWDNPKVIFNVTENQSKAQLIAIGNGFQRSDDVLGVVVANWLKVSDPFATSPLAPYRHVPNVGHVIGAWIRCIGQKGVHYIPAVPTNPIYGAAGVVGDTFLNDRDRTDIAEAGMNVIQEAPGKGILIKNFFTPSTTQEFIFANGILMREYFKISFVDSLSDTLNEPNNFERIKESRMAVLNFFYRHWDVGSTGNVPSGETFGQSIKPDGTSTSAEDHFVVQADLINNPQDKINAGERNVDSWFTYPSPAGSIKIGVGLMLL